MTEKFTKRHLVGNHVKRAIYALLAAGLASLLAEVFIRRHGSHPWEGIFGFYPIYSLAACVLLALVATLVRKVLMRQENYYDG